MTGLGAARREALPGVASRRHHRAHQRRIGVRQQLWRPRHRPARGLHDGEEPGGRRPAGGGDAGRQPRDATGRSGAARRWIAPARHRRAADARGRRSLASWLGLAYVGVMGGGMAFILFFEGSRPDQATPAAFLATRWSSGSPSWPAVPPRAAERLERGGHRPADGRSGGRPRGESDTSPSAAGDVLVLVGHLAVGHRGRHLQAPAGRASPRRRPRSSGWGSVARPARLPGRHRTRQRTALAFRAAQLGWALLTGLLLAGYVGTWMTALARARAVDVTSVLVASTVVTTLLQRPPEPRPSPPRCSASS